MTRVTMPIFRLSVRRNIACLLVVALAFGLAAVRVHAAADPLPAAKPLEALERPDRVSADLLARVEGRRVEITDYRTEDSSTFVNPDGTFTSEIHAGPIRVWRDAEPAKSLLAGWRDIDVTLVSDASGVHPVAAKPDIRFSKGGRGEAARLAHGGRSIGFGLEGVDLPAPILAGAVARYPNVAAGVDLEFEALPAGFSERLVVRERPASPLVWRFPLSLSGQSISQDASGNISLRDGAGKLVGLSDPAQMWGAELHPVSGDPLRRAKVTTRIVRGASGGLVLEIAPDFAFLSDPSVQLPIVVDPSPTLFAAADTFVQNDWLVSQWTATELRAGSWNGGTSQTRSMVKFDVSTLSQKNIISATMKLYNSYSSSIYNRQANIYALNGSFISSTTWTNQPAIAATVYGSAWVGATTPAWANFGLTNLVAEWAAGTRTNYGVSVRMASETDSLAYRRFHSADNATGKPILEVTYNSYPNTPTYPLPNTAARLNSLTPKLDAIFSDGDGGNGAVRVDVYKNSDGTPVLTSQQGAWVASGQRSAWTVPANNLVNGTTYKWRSRGYDGVDNGINYTAYYTFTVDMTEPNMPTTSSADYPLDAWAKGAGQAGVFTFNSTSTDLAGYLWELDNPTPQTFKSATGQTTQTITPATEGPHTLYVRAKDTAGNLSPVAAYTFKVGNVAITAPHDGDATQRNVTLKAVSVATSTSVTYQYSRGNSVWTTIPAGHVTNGGTPLSVWPVLSPGGVAPTLVWDAATTINFIDGPVQVKAIFDGAGTPTSLPLDLTLDQKAFGGDYATTAAGPGIVNLTTGNFSVSATDVSVAAWGTNLSVSRTLNSRDAAASSTGIFGPGWLASIPQEAAGTEFVSLHSGEEASEGAFVTILQSDGSTIGFTKSGATYVAEDGVEGLTLTHPTSEYRISDLDGNTTVFTKPVGAADYVPTQIIEPGSNNATTSTYEVVGGVTRVKQILAPVPQGVASCAPLQAGCRALTFTYSTANTATGTAEANWGAFTGRLERVDFTGYNPATSAMTTIPVASYLYDFPDGRLRAGWDPRNTSELKIRHAYDAAGRVTQITPPGGDAAWNIAYQAAGGDPDTGRLRSVSRTGPQGAAATTFVYNVALASPYAMTATDVDAWAQNDKPVSATAVFPPDQIPADPISYERASIFYLNADGREVNVAAPGGYITTTEYDGKGNIIRTLTAANRAAALAYGPNAADHAARATLLDTDTTYSADGLELTDEYGPLTEMMLANNTIVEARSHVRNIHDEGALAGGPYHLITTVEEGARIPGDTVDVDKRTSKTTYDWALRRPLEQITDPAGINLIAKTFYDTATGLITETRLPGGPNGGDAHATKTLYYTAGTQTDTTCAFKPAWANLVCKIMDGTPTPILPVKTFEYGVWNQVTKVTETIGSDTRTSILGYDAAGRQESETTTATLGVSIPAATTTYSTLTGRLLTTQTIDGATTQTVTRAYDTLGRLTNYTDASGKTTTRTYDLLNRPATTTDERGTTTYAYNEGTERRGLPTSIVVSSIGTFAATYNADGAAATRTYPNDLVATTTRNASGAPTSLTYDKTTNCGAQCRWLSFTVNESPHGQQRTQTSSLSNQDYTYDAAGRLALTKDTPAGAGCTTRAYTLDADSNRTRLTTRAPLADGTCDTTSAGTITDRTYDDADRSTLTGYTHDGFGRITNVPAAEAGSTLTVTHYVNDLARSITMQSGATRTWTLDPGRRFLTQIDSSPAVTRTNYYANDNDSPSWIQEGTAWTRHIAGIDGDLAATEDSAGAKKLQLANLHGDIIATADPSPTISTLQSTLESTEYGMPRTTGQPLYGWLGAKQRQTDSLSGVILMGVRLYLPGSGRFLQVDPVPGGSHNAYEYAGQDPVNNRDLDGRRLENGGGAAYPRCDSLKLSDYQSQGAASGSSFKVSYQGGSLHWNFLVGPKYQRGSMGNVVTITYGSKAGLGQQTGRRILRAPSKPNRGVQNHGSVALRSGTLVTISVMFYGRDSSIWGVLLGAGGVWGYAHVTCRC